MTVDRTAESHEFVKMRALAMLFSAARNVGSWPLPGPWRTAERWGGRGMLHPASTSIAAPRASARARTSGGPALMAGPLPGPPGAIGALSGHLSSSPLCAAMSGAPSTHAAARPGRAHYGLRPTLHPNAEAEDGRPCKPSSLRVSSGVTSKMLIACIPARALAQPAGSGWRTQTFRPLRNSAGPRSTRACTASSFVKARSGEVV
jgi:hypothetical protein